MNDPDIQSWQQQPPWRLKSANREQQEVPLPFGNSDLFESRLQGPSSPETLTNQEIKKVLRVYGVTKFVVTERKELIDLLIGIECILPLVGSWKHGRPARQYQMQLSEDGNLKWQGPHVTGGTLAGVIYAHGTWLRAELYSRDEEKIGSVRIRHGPKWNQLTSNFFSTTMSDWGKEIVASRASEELLCCRPPFDDELPPQQFPPATSAAQGYPPAFGGNFGGMPGPWSPPVRPPDQAPAPAFGGKLPSTSTPLLPPVNPEDQDDLSALGIEQLKECLREYGVTDWARCCNQKEALVELLQNVEAALPLLGTWEYGKTPKTKKYEVQFTDEGQLRWEGPHSQGGTILGTLHEEGGWLQAELTTKMRQMVGSIRIRHGPKWDEITSNFKSLSMVDWGSDIVAHRTSLEQPRRRAEFKEEEPKPPPSVVDPASLSLHELKQCLREYGVTKFDNLDNKKDSFVELLEHVENTLPLVGTWEQARSARRYELQHTEDGALLFEGPHVTGGTLVGVCYEDVGYLRAELLTCQEESELIGSVRISHGPDWHEVTLNFQTTNTGAWGKDIVVERISPEEQRRRPEFSKVLYADDVPEGDAVEEEEEEDGSQYWEGLEILSQALRVEHASEQPRERRAHSWARTLAFTQMTLGMQGTPIRKGTEDDPFVYWILGATDEVEVSLAEAGFFKDANWLDRAPTKIYLIGHQLRDINSNCANPQTPKHPARVAPLASVTKDEAATWTVVHPRVFARDQPQADARCVGDLFKGTEVRGREEGGWLRLDAASAELCLRLRQRDSGAQAWVLIDGRDLGLGALLERKSTSTQRATTSEAASGASGPEVCCLPYRRLHELADGYLPDLVVILMPNLAHEIPQDPPQGDVPESVLDMVSDVPIVISTRFEHAPQALRRTLGSQLLLPQVRCPFSAAAGDPSARYDDNGWIFAVRGGGSVDRAVSLGPQDLHSGRPGKTPALFWGIIDLKYDSSKNVFERVRVLETGDGRISKFSGDGAPIQELFDSCYQLEERDVELQTYNFISKDKKVTHDLFAMTGYSHVVPAQVCVPRAFHPGIASRIVAELEVSAEELVVLKLCNRSRAAGVIVAQASDLDSTLQQILTPPSNMEAWFKPQLQRLSQHSAVDFSASRDSPEDHMRHWWANECPNCVVERCCSSVPTFQGGKAFDGTMRVAFALCRRGSTSSGQDGVGSSLSGTLTPEDIVVDWLGGYWKLPKVDMFSPNLRERIISEAKTGTALVMPSILYEIYAALGGALQQLFGAAEFTPATLAEQYKSEPEFGAYLTARLTMTLSKPEERSKSLTALERTLAKLPENRAKSAARSFISRAKGVLVAKDSSIAPNERWKRAQEHFQNAVSILPSNANAWFLMGMCILEGMTELDSDNLEMATNFMNRSILLDSDFRAPYVNLGVIYLRRAAQASENNDPTLAEEMCIKAVEISEACLLRHKASPQCNYHVAVACTQLAICLQAQGATSNDAQFRSFRERAWRHFEEARSSTEAQRRLSEWQAAQLGPESQRKKQQAPWLPVDDRMLQAMEAPMVQGQVLKPIKLPAYIGWRLPFWRL